MEKPYTVFEHFAQSMSSNVRILDVAGHCLYSSLQSHSLDFLYTVLDCQEACKVSILYGCFQASRFGGRYIFTAPDGLVYCTSPLYSEQGGFLAGVVAGPFLLTEMEDYLEIDVLSRKTLEQNQMELLKKELQSIPYRTPIQMRSISEMLYITTSHNAKFHGEQNNPQVELFAPYYPLQKEDELLDAIKQGDIRAAGSALNYILGQVLFASDKNIEVLRLRVVELTVLLSRAALKGGANPDAILGLNYSFLQEIDSLGTQEDIILWLHNVTRRFSQHVFDFADAKHLDMIYKATDFMKQNYAQKLSLQDIAEHVYLSSSYFSKIFKDETGQTPGNYLTVVRVNESKRLLRDLTINMIDIPESVGFDSQSYYNKVFKKIVGCTPGKYRKQELE